MSDDALRDILKRADATAEAPPKMPADLAARVRRRAARRSRTRVMGGCVAAAVVVLATGVTAYFWSASDTNIPNRDPAANAVVNADSEQYADSDMAAIRAELDALRREADARLAVARRTREILGRMEKADAASETEEEVPDAVANARREVDRAAYTLVVQADRMCREMKLCDSAMVKYERVIRLFPETRWATVAKDRLNEIRQKGELS